MGSSPRSSELSKPKRKPQPAPFERRVTRFVALLVAPGLLISGIVIWLQPWAAESKLFLLVAEVFLCLLIGAALHEHIMRPLQTLANVVGALREEDYSFRARLAVPNDALGELSLEVNTLADLLAQHRTGAMEATTLLQRVVEEVGIPIFAFDPQESLRLVNTAGESLLQQSSPRVIGKTATELGLKTCLTCENDTLVPLRFNTDARWLVRRSSFRQQGVPHTLVILSDVSRALREEERRAWQRLIRVLGHELNNSLAPIKSIAGSLNARLAATGLQTDEQQDFERGLTIIRIAGLETRVEVKVVPGPDVIIMADPDQLEQMLINLLRNAAEAMLEPSASGEKSNGSRNSLPGEFVKQVVCGWKLTDKDVVLTIEDSGPGLMNPSNTFVPFYTTKPGGSGIGLVLSRQIAEGHGGSLELLNRDDQRGCVVKVRLPRVNPA